MEPNQTKEWYNVIGKFKDKAREFASVFTQVQQSGPIAAKSPELNAQYQVLMKKGLGIKNKIEAVTGSLDNAYSWIRENMGLEAAEDGLGIIGPAIPIAIAVGLVAAMTPFITDSYIYLEKVKRFDRLEQQYGPERAVAIIGKIGDKPTMIEGIIKPLLPILGLGVVWWMWGR